MEATFGFSLQVLCPMKIPIVEANLYEYVRLTNITCTIQLSTFSLYIFNTCNNIINFIFNFFSN